MPPPCDGACHDPGDQQPGGLASAGVDTHEPVLSDELFGCIAVGTTATAIGAAAGSVNLINLVVCGVVLPSNPVILVTGLIGVVWLSFCEIGEKLTSLGGYAYEQ